MDACLMAQLEVFSMLATHALYAVASEEVVPSIGYSYTYWLSRLTDDPTMDGAAVAEAIVEGYIDDDTTITDDDVREELLSDMGIEDVGAETYAEAEGQSTTISAVDLTLIGDVNAALNAYVDELRDENPLVIARSRCYVQSYTPYFGEGSSSYIDLVNFAKFVQALSDHPDRLEQATSDLVDAVSAAVTTERHGDKVSGSNGMAIFCPPIDVFATDDNFNYSELAAPFTTDTDWDDRSDTWPKIWMGTTAIPARASPSRVRQCAIGATEEWIIAARRESAARALSLIHI